MTPEAGATRIGLTERQQMLETGARDQVGATDLPGFCLIIGDGCLGDGFGYVYVQPNPLGMMTF